MKPVYEDVSIVPLRGLVRNPDDEITKNPDGFSNVVNFVLPGKAGLWEARTGQRAFVLRTVTAGLDIDGHGHFFDSRDTGNYTVAEVFFRTQRKSYPPNPSYVKFLPWVKWKPSLGVFPSPVVEYTDEVFDPARFPAAQTINPNAVYDSAFLIFQRLRYWDGYKDIFIFDNKVIDVGTYKIVPGLVYCYLLPSIPEDDAFVELPVTLGRYLYPVSEAYGWGWHYILSADWSWQSPLVFLLFGTDRSMRPELPYKRYRGSSLLAPWGYKEWNDDTFSNPLYWQGQSISLGYYTVVTRYGWLQDYELRQWEADDGTQLQLPSYDPARSTIRINYLIGDLLIYDGESVREQGQETERGSHGVVMQENSVGRVGNDILELDLRLGEGQENDAVAGVDGPLTLYKFYADMSYTYREDITYPKSVFDVLKDVPMHPKAPGWFLGKGLYEADTGRSYFAKTHNYGTQGYKDDNPVEYDRAEGEFVPDLSQSWGTFSRNGFSWTGYDPESWNDIAHKMLVSRLMTFWLWETPFPEKDYMSTNDGVVIEGGRRYYMRLDRADGNHILYSKVIWGSARRPLISGWTRIVDTAGEEKKDEVTPAGISNALLVDAQSRFIIANSQNVTPFPDLLKKVVLFDPLRPSITEQGDKSTDYSIDVHRAIAAGTFRWSQVQIRYYPCSGRVAGTYLLCHYDRLWDRMEDAPRVYDVSIPREDSPEALLPVAGWSYRFVYEYFDGTFSAPSPVYQAPTLLFSPLKDEEIIDLCGGGYKRPIVYSGDGTEAVWNDGLDPYNTKIRKFIRSGISPDGQSVVIGSEGSANILAKYPTMTPGLSALDRYWTTLRQAIFPEDHPYYSIELPATVTAENYYEYIDKFAARFTLIALYDETGTDAYQTLTPVGEGLCISEMITLPDVDADNMGNIAYRLVKVFASIPFLPRVNKKSSYNSVFSQSSSPYGEVYRMTYRRQPDVGHWDTLSPSAPYVFFPDWCLLTGGPVGTIPFQPNGATTNWGQLSGVTNAPPLYLPFVPLAATDPHTRPLVIPDWALRRSIDVRPWSDWNEAADAFPWEPGSGNEWMWLDWAKEQKPYCDVPNSYIQFCFEGENITMSPIKSGFPKNKAGGWNFDGDYGPYMGYPFDIDDGLTSDITVDLWVPQFPNGRWQDLYTTAELGGKYSRPLDDRRSWNFFFHHHPLGGASSEESPAWWDYSMTALGMHEHRQVTACGLWDVYRENSSSGVCSQTIYLNVIAPLWDKNNEYSDWKDKPTVSDVIPPSALVRHRLRVPSILRYIRNSVASFGIVKAGVPKEVVDRIILPGVVPLRLAQSRYRNPSGATKVSFAGTRRTYNAHSIGYKDDSPFGRMRASRHDTMVVDFTEMENKGIVANVPHLKSRWCPIIPGHALSTFSPKHGTYVVNADKASPVFTGALGVFALYDSYGGLGGVTRYAFGSFTNLYSRSPKDEPHWMLFDGVVWHSWNVNRKQGAVAPTDTYGRSIELKENPRMMPPWRVPALQTPERTDIVGEWFVTIFPTAHNYIHPNKSPFIYGALAKNIPLGGIHYPVWGIGGTHGPLANTQYPPSPFNTFLNNFWKYVPLQQFVLQNARDYDNNNVKFWYANLSGYFFRPYYYDTLSFGARPDGSWGYASVGLGSDTNLFTNYPAGVNWERGTFFVRFPRDASNRPQFPTATDRATIVAYDGEPANVPGILRLQPHSYRLSYGITDLWFDPSVATIDNVDVEVYLRGHRALFVEQATMYYTSKQIFDAPRLGLWFKKEAVPPRVRRIHIYRTRHIDDNAWHPDEFGYVGSVECEWGINEQGERTKDVYFFDNVPDSRLDFTDDITRFEALEFGLSSVAATVLSERAYYGNFRERYLPLRTTAFSKARGGTPGWGICAYREVDVLHTLSTGFLTAYQQRTHAMFPGWVRLYGNGTPPATRYNASDYNSYWTLSPSVEHSIFTSSVDVSGYFSDVFQPLTSESTSVEFFPTVESNPAIFDSSSISVGVYGISHPVDNIEKTLVWANVGSTNLGQWRAVASVEKGDGGTALDYGVPDNVVAKDYPRLWQWVFSSTRYHQSGQFKKLPYTKPIIYDFRSAVRWSDLRMPHVIRGSNIEFVREGDGDEIMALVPTYNGNLVVFKRRSIVRLMLAGGFEIARRDQVSDTHGIIAPNAWVTYKNNIFFVSHDGIYAYDDNAITRIDLPIRDELVERLSTLCNGIPDPALSLVTVALNRERGEIYFSIPAFPSYDPWYHLSGVSPEKRPSHVGVVFVYYPELNIWTKLEYPSLTLLSKANTNFTTSADVTHITGWLHQSRTYYTDKYNRFWAIPRLPSTLLHGRQVFIETTSTRGAEPLPTIWSGSIDDVFGEFSFSNTGTIVNYSPSLAPPNNIYRRPVRAQATSVGIRGDLTIKQKVRQFAAIASWRVVFENTSYSPQYDRNVGTAPMLVSTIGFEQAYQSGGGSVEYDRIVGKFAWFSDTPPGDTGYMYGLSGWTDYELLPSTVYQRGGEWTCVVGPESPIANFQPRGEIVYLHLETLGASVFKGWKLYTRPAEQWLR